MSVTDLHDRELSQAMWAALPALRARHGELYDRNPKAFFRLAGDAARVRDMRAVIAIGQVLSARDGLASAPARKLSFASHYAASLSEHARFKEALAVLEDPRSADVGHHKYWRQLAHVLAGAGRLADARTAVEQSLRIRPDFRPAKELAADLAAMGELKARIPSFR